MLNLNDEGKGNRDERQNLAEFYLRHQKTSFHHLDFMIPTFYRSFIR